MLSKYKVEYSLHLKGHSSSCQYYTDDPVACGEFLLELLENNLKVQAIRHDGLDLPKADFDKMIKKAAGMLAAKSICAALDISSEEEHYRFGFVA